MLLASLTLLYVTLQDMIDTGKTMVKLVDTLREYKPADLKVAR
jgi:hypoxanthine-guanine phosphoribosyltransferase